MPDKFNVKNPKTLANSKLHQTVAHNIRRLRLEKGWSQEKLAIEAEVHRVYVGRVERC